MKEPTLGVFIPTHGDIRLERTLHSIATQKLITGDDVLIVGDGYHKWTDDLVKDMGSPFRYLHTKRTKDWGHTQANLGMKLLQTDYITGQDHDDIYAPRAFEKIREAMLLSPNRPLMVRVRTPHLGILWSAPATPPFDGHCLVIPNDKEKLGQFTSAYDGDQQYIEQTITKFGNVTWVDVVATLTRPTWKLYYYPISTGKDHWSWNFYDDDLFVGELSLRLIDNKMYGGWSPNEIDKQYWSEITEFMLWAAQEDVYVDARSQEQRIFLRNMGFRQEIVSKEMHSYWPPTEDQWNSV